MKATDNFTLSNGVTIPCIGFGTWQIESNIAAQCVKTAIETGYRHIDTAAIYKNEVAVGKGIAESGVARKDLFVTSKVWNSERGYKKTLAAFNKTLSDLGLEYLDLYLIHWPATQKRTSEWQKLNSDTWRAFEKLYKDGRIRAIGVSNFLSHHLTPLIENAQIIPMVNQLEFHPGYMQAEAVETSRKNKMLVQAWSPLGTGKMLDNPTLMEIAKKYQKSVAQICIRWCLQNETLPLPKSTNAGRIKENLNVFDFEISKADMETINAMPYFGGSGLHPDEIKF